MGPTGEYNDRWIFHFEGDNGTEYKVLIKERDYYGEADNRALGGGVVLKRDRNDAICGTSLEITAEAEIDGEFAALYTSDARQFYVQLVYLSGNDWLTIWQGFVAPELYSEPDIAPPYDVQIIATDGLGELKSYEFPESGRVSLYEHIKTCLDNSGIICEAEDIELMNGIHSVSPALYSPDLLSVRTDLDHLSGQSCYDVLTKILVSLNAKLTYDLPSGRWCIVRYNDLDREAWDAGGGYVQISNAPFGSMDTCDYWPIGHLSADVLPAKRKLSVALPYYVRKSILTDSDFGIGWRNQWTSSGNIFDANIRGAGARPFLLPVGEDCYVRQSVQLDATTKSITVSVGILSGASGKATAYMEVKLTIGSTVRYLRKTDNGYGWSTSAGEIELTGAQVGSTGQTSVYTISDFTNNNIDFLQDLGDGTVQLTVRAKKSDTSSIFAIGWIYLTTTYPAGFRDTVNMGNDARESLADVELAFGDAEVRYNALRAVYNILSVGSSDTLTGTGWQHHRIDGSHSFLELMAIDRAIIDYAPRVAYKGKLFVGTEVPPLLFTQDGALYLCETMSWDVLESELECELVRQSDATDVTVSSSTIVEMSEDQAKSGGASGGGGGGGAIGTYASLPDKPAVNGHTLIGDMSAGELGLGTYNKPATGIPSTDMDENVRAALRKANYFRPDVAGRLFIESDGGVVLWDDDQSASVIFYENVLYSDASAALGRSDQKWSEVWTDGVYFDIVDNVKRGMWYNGLGKIRANLPLLLDAIEFASDGEEQPTITYSITEEEGEHITFSTGGQFNGDVWCDTLHQSSDARLKENVVDIEEDDARDVLDRLRPVDFDWKDSGNRGFGFIAQEVAEILPDIVKEKSDGKLSLNYTGIIAFLVKGWQEQDERIAELEMRLEQLTK